MRKTIQTARLLTTEAKHLTKFYIHKILHIDHRHTMNSTANGQLLNYDVWIRVLHMILCIGCRLQTIQQV